jgi:hypothetical protein
MKWSGVKDDQGICLAFQIFDRMASRVSNFSEFCEIYPEKLSGFGALVNQDARPYQTGPMPNDCPANSL